MTSRDVSDSVRHGTLAGYRRHKKAGESPCEDCMRGAREEWKDKARRRYRQRPDQVRASNRRSWQRAVRCVVCSLVVKPAELVHVEPLRGAPDKRLPCHAPCAQAHGRRVVAGAGTAPDRGQVA